jgi:carbamate kinase
VAHEVPRGALVVAALGGNAIQAPDGDDTVESDFSRTMETARYIAELIEHGYRLVITHGNGPQVGNHLLRSEIAHALGRLPPLPLDVCVADTQGGMGYMLQQCISDALHERGHPAVVASLVTQTLVDRDDPAFSAPSKPIGETIAGDRVDELKSQGWALVEDRHRHAWRRVVASPDPKEIVEAAAIKRLVEDGIITIAAGGGGIPVVHGAGGTLEGIAAVVDKDLASALLATDLQADALLILTDVDRIRLGYDTDDERPVDELSIEEARGYLSAGEFAPGSMGPKVEALCRFAATGGGAIVTSVDRAADALEGDAGTRITPGVA